MPHTRSNRASPASAAPADSKPRAELRAAEQEECSSLQSCPTCPAVSVQGARSAVPRLTLAADAGGQCVLVLSVAAQIVPGTRARFGIWPTFRGQIPDPRTHPRSHVPVRMDQMGSGAPRRPARWRPGLTARAAALVRARPVHHRAGPGLRLAHVGAGAAPGAPIGAWPARWSRPAKSLDAAAGRRLMALLVDGGIGPPEQTGLRLACPRVALRSAGPQILYGQSSAAPDRC
jgi:hypothetical protein